METDSFTDGEIECGGGVLCARGELGVLSRQAEGCIAAKSLYRLSNVEFVM